MLHILVYDYCVCHIHYYVTAVYVNVYYYITVICCICYYMTVASITYMFRLLLFTFIKSQLAILLKNI